MPRMWVKSVFRKSYLPALVGGSTVTGGTVVYLLSSEDNKRKVSATCGASYRIANLVGTVGVIAADYFISTRFMKPNDSEYDNLSKKLQEYQTDQEQSTLKQWKAKDKKEEQYWKDQIANTRENINATSESLAALSTAGGLSSLSTVHTRSAIRVRDLCTRNKGVYIKLGQHLSQLDHILPDEYTTTLRALLANNPISSWESVQRVIREDLNSNPSDIWDNIVSFN